MAAKNITTDRILCVLLKEPFTTHTVTSIAKALDMTRQGIWKTLNKLSVDKLISLEPVNDAKTSTVTIKLNFDNPATEKKLSLLLTQESLKQQRWQVNFAELEKKVNFLILFGSILNNSKEANDIDILAVVNKKNFKAIDEVIAKVQLTQVKKIHLVSLTAKEFRHELKKQNKAYLDAVKKGVILFGQDSFIRGFHK